MNDSDGESILRNKVITGIKWATMVRVASQAFSWVVTLAMVRLLTPHDYGLNSMIEVPIEVLVLFSTLGIDAAIIRIGKHSPEQLASAFGYLLALNFLFFLILFLFSNLIAEYFKEPGLTTLIQVTAVIFLLAPFRIIPNALLDIDLDFKLKAQVELAAAIISSTIALCLAVIGAGVWALVSAIVLGSVIRAGLLAYKRPWIIKPSLKMKPILPLVRFGIVIVAQGTVGVLSGKILTLLAGPKVGVETLGFFAVASVFAMLPMNKLMPIVQQTMYPVISRLHDQPALSKKYLLKSLEYTSLVIFPMAIGTACLSEHIISVIFGQKWLPMAVPLTLLASVTPARLLNQIFAAPLNAVGRAKTVTAVHILNLTMLATGSLFAANYGLIGLVYLTIFSTLVATVVSIIIGCRIFELDIKKLILAVKPALVSSLLMAFALWLAAYEFNVFSNIVGLIFEVSIGVFVYLFSLLLLFRKTAMNVLNTLKQSD